MHSRISNVVVCMYVSRAKSRRCFKSMHHSTTTLRCFVIERASPAGAVLLISAHCQQPSKGKTSPSLRRCCCARSQHRQQQQRHKRHSSSSSGTAPLWASSSPSAAQDDHTAVMPLDVIDVRSTAGAEGAGSGGPGSASRARDGFLSRTGRFSL